MVFMVMAVTAVMVVIPGEMAIYHLAAVAETDTMEVKAEEVVMPIGFLFLVVMVRLGAMPMVERLEKVAVVAMEAL